MRLFVTCRHNPSNRTYLTTYAETPEELIERIGGYNFEIECPFCPEVHIYSIGEVRAERGPLYYIPAGAVGGIIGLLGGPLGLLIGGGIGILMGANADAAEEERVRRFNREVVR